MVTCRTPHGVGKTVTAAMIVCAFMCTRKDAIVISTAPTEHQVRNLLWSWIGKMHAASKKQFPGEPDRLQWIIDPRWYAKGISTDKPGRISGFHGSGGVEGDEAFLDDGEELPEGEELVALLEQAKANDGGILFVFDEAAHIAQEIFEFTKGALVEEETYCLMTANADLDIMADHEFVRSHKPESGFYKIKVALEKGPPDPLIPDLEIIGAPKRLVTPEWIIERKKEWGPGSPYVYSKIWGQFAPGNLENRVFPSQLVSRAESNTPEVKLGAHIGVDVAYAGGDQNCASLWVDGVKRAQYQWTQDVGDPSPSSKIAHIILELRKTWSRDLTKAGYLLKHDGAGDPMISVYNIHVDAASWGAGACDRLYEMGYHIDRVDFSKLPYGDWRSLTGDMLFKNRRAELHWVMRRATEEGMLRLESKWKESQEQAQWACYELRESSQGTVILIEPKDKIRKRHGRSPDNWDSDLLAWSRSGAPALSFSTRR